MNGLLYKFLRWCPGASGLLLRQKLYPRLFGSCGSGLLCGRFVDVVHPERITLGSNVIINDYVRLSAASVNGRESYITLDNNVFIGVGCILQAQGQSITIKVGASLGSYCLVTAETSSVTIGTSTLLAAYGSIGVPVDLEGMVEVSMVGDQERRHISPTVIGDGCWLGVRAEISAGVLIEDGCIVGAHADVRSDLPSNVVAIGRPATILRARQTRPNELETA